MLIKICGLTSREDAELAVAAGADLVGFVFVPGTPRFVDPSAADWLREVSGAQKVGVFRDVRLAEVMVVRRRLGLDRIQLHGSEPEAWGPALGPGTLRAIRVGSTIPWDRVRRLVTAGCVPLLDSGGGTGRIFSWQLLENRPGDVCFGLAGGLGPENVDRAVRLARPWLVDVSSGVEAAPGRKDPDKVTAFVTTARRAAATM